MLARYKAKYAFADPPMRGVLTFGALGYSPLARPTRSISAAGSSPVAMRRPPKGMTSLLVARGNAGLRIIADHGS